MIFTRQWVKILVKKKLKSIYFTFIRCYDFYALVTKGLKWLTVFILVGRINLLWKQIDVSVGFGCKLYIYILLCRIESSVRKIKVSMGFEMIDFQWGFKAIFMIPFSHLNHENVRGPGTKYISWAIKMPWKGKKSFFMCFSWHFL